MLAQLAELPGGLANSRTAKIKREIRNFFAGYYGVLDVFLASVIER